MEVSDQTTMVPEGDGGGVRGGQMGAGNGSRERTHAKAAGRKRANQEPKKKMLKI